MSSTAANSEAIIVKELAEKIHQFLSHQAEFNNELSDPAKESIIVAAECIEQAYMFERKPASRDLLDVYKKHCQQTTNSQQPSLAGNLGATLVQNLANTILSQATAGATARSSNTGNTSEGPIPTAPPQSTTTSSSEAGPRKPRVKATEAEKMAAESFKNQGNDAMKQDNYREAFDYYSHAISIDNNNAIYYSNRAAASSKLGDHQAALRDCQEAIEIDSSYSKAYGRMGLAYASLEDHQRARDAYIKAVELDPNNESYRNNLKIAEEKLGESANAAGSGQFDMMSMLRSMVTNPQVMQMAMRGLQDPRMQSLFNMGAGAATTPPSTDQSTLNNNGSGQAENSSSQASAQQQTNAAPSANADQQPAGGLNPADLFNLTSRLAGTANIDIVDAGQQLLSSIEQSNPELVNNMRRMMNQAFMPPSNRNDSDQNPPPGYS